MIFSEKVWGLAFLATIVAIIILVVVLGTEAEEPLEHLCRIRVAGK